MMYYEKKVTPTVAGAGAARYTGKSGSSVLLTGARDCGAAAVDDRSRI